MPQKTSLKPANHNCEVTSGPGNATQDQISIQTNKSNGKKISKRGLKKKKKSIEGIRLFLLLMIEKDNRTSLISQRLTTIGWSVF